MRLDFVPRNSNTTETLTKLITTEPCTKDPRFLINMNSFSAIYTSCILLSFFTNIITIVALEAMRVESRNVNKAASFQNTSTSPSGDKSIVDIFASFAYCDDERGGEDFESQRDVADHTPDLVRGQNRRRMQNDESCSSNNFFLDERFNVA